ncbi:MAG: trigger factor [Vicinamibacterales bacterium]
MKTELVDVNETRKNLVVEIPSDVVDAQIDRVTTRYGHAARLPGFRPGKIPAKVVRQRFRSQILHEVAHELVEKAVGDALTERGVEPVDTPDIRDLTVEEGRPLTFTAQFEIVPTFDPGTFESISARRRPVVVDDETVEQALGRLRERAARYEPVEGAAAEDGHTLTVDMERQAVERDGRQGEKQRHEGVTVELGGTANPPGFDDQLKGLAPGAIKTFTIRYPDDHGVAELAGTEAHYRVTVHDIRRRVVPELDDEFAKDVGDFDTLDALRARVREDLAAEAREAAERETRGEVLRALGARVPFEVPAALVEREVDRRLQDFASRLMAQQIDPRQAKIDWAAFREGQREPALDAVRSALVLDEIARREQVGVSEVEIDQEVERYAQQVNRTPAAVRARLEQDGGLERIALGIRREKALAHAMSRATIVEV